jgi:Sigma-70, region 4
VVIEMAYLDGISQPRIALALGVPLGTVKGRLRLGLAKLRVAYVGPENAGRLKSRDLLGNLIGQGFHTRCR